MAAEKGNEKCEKGKVFHISHFTFPSSLQVRSESVGRAKNLALHQEPSERNEWSESG
jgi:hypothetical protein